MILTLENFLPFRRPVTLDFTRRGLIHVRGRNLVSSAADSNGTGKTSVAHGLSYAWFGEDLSGRRADAVACRFTAGQCVAHYEDEDALGKWSVTRTRRPASLSSTGIPGVLENEDAAVLQGKVEQRLGFGVRTFRNAVVFGQGAFDRFAQADQAEAMRMLDEIQGVDFRDSLERAKAWRDDLKAKLADLLYQAGVAEQRRQDAEASAADLVAARNGYERERHARLAQAVQRKANAQVAMRGALAAEASARDAAAQVAKLRQLSLAASALLHETGVTERATDAAASATREVAAKRDDLKGRLAALLEESACPTCRQSVKAKAAIEKLFAKDLASLQLQVDAAQRAEAAAYRRHTAAVKKYEERLRKMAEAVPDGADFSRHLALMEHIASDPQARARAANRAAADRDMAAAIAEIAEAEGAQWSGADALAQAQQNAAALRASIEAAAPTHRKLKAAVEMAEYWVEGYGDRGIRSLLVDGVADFVNNRARAHLEELAGGEAQLRMSAQTELKKGGSRERISFTPEWDWGGAGAGTGSGGQDRRVDLALFAAVQDLAESRSARPFPVKIFDEPFDALDTRGKELAAAWVKRQARERGTAVLITHSEEMAALVEADVTWTVVMDGDGARVEES